jgi:hypothetical protein
MPYPANLDIHNCVKGPSQGGIPIAELKALAQEMGIDITGMKKQNICDMILALLLAQQHQETPTIGKSPKIASKVLPKKIFKKVPVTDNSLTLEVDDTRVNIYICGKGTFGIKENIKSSLSGKWDPSKKCWYIQYNQPSIEKLGQFFGIDREILENIAHGDQLSVSFTGVKKEVIPKKVTTGIRIHPLELIVRKKGNNFTVGFVPPQMASIMKSFSGRWNPTKLEWILPMSSLNGFKEELKIPDYWIREPVSKSWEINNINEAIKNIDDLMSYDDQITIIKRWTPNSIHGTDVIIKWKGDDEPDPYALFLKANNWQPHYYGTVTKLQDPYYLVNLAGTD